MCLICLATTTIRPTLPPPEQTCKVKLDIGFILDSSGSITKNYQDEKDFLKAVAGSFGVSQDETRAGVITFSHYVEHSIQLKDHADTSSFNAAVDAIPLMGSVTRIDKALRLTQKEMFTYVNGGRMGIRKMLILLTDGSQTKTPYSEDPALIADELRQEGITFIVVGMGQGINLPELTKIAGGSDKTFGATSFIDLLSGPFIRNVQDTACKGEYLNRRIQ